MTPMHVVDAPVPGAGKSYVLDTTAVISTGQLMPVIAAGRTAEETEKRLGSALLAGQPLITIDNVSGELSGDALCQIIERPRPQVRILGKSELVDGRDPRHHAVRQRQQYDHRRRPLPPCHSRPA